jgi:hypothetical protein
MMHINIYFTNICSRRYWSSYPSYIKPPLSMVFWPPIHAISNPLPIVFNALSPFAHCISNPCIWYYDTLHPWYIESPAYVISTPLPMVFWPHYPSYDTPPTYVISSHISMVFWSYPWYFDPPIYGTSFPFVLDC